MMSQRKSMTLVVFILITIVILLCGELSLRGSNVFDEGATYLLSEQTQSEFYLKIVGLENPMLETSKALKTLEVPIYSNFPDLGTTTVEVNNSTANIATSIKEYNLTFEETGLPTGTIWTISLNGMNKSSNSSLISFSEPNGTYNYEVGIISGFTVSQFAGQQPVSGSSIIIHILYSELYAITFNESGLPNGISWSIAFNGSTKSSLAGSGSIQIIETNGTYPYTINLPENYTTFPTTGNMIVNGSAVLKNIQFKLYAITFTGLLSPTNASLFIDGRLVQVVDGVFTLTLTAGQKYEIEVKAPGYENYYYNMTVTSRTLPTVLLNISLTKIQTNLIPSNFLIYLAIIAVVTTVIIVALWTVMMNYKRKQ